METNVLCSFSSHTQKGGYARLYTDWSGPGQQLSSLFEVLGHTAHATPRPQPPIADGAVLTSLTTSAGCALMPLVLAHWLKK